MFWVFRRGAVKTATVLLTGAGGAAIPDLIRHLKGLGHRVLTCDMNPQAPGLYLGDGGFVVPRATNPNFQEHLECVCWDNGVNVFIPLVDEEIVSARRVAFLDGVLSPDHWFTRACLDKWTLAYWLNQHRLPTPQTRLLSQCSHSPTYPTPFAAPWVIKPRVGRGSLGVAVVKSDTDIANHLQGEPNHEAWIVQEYIEGPEYTVSVVCDQHNTVHAVVPKEIILKQSSTRLAVTRRNEKIDALCRRIAEALNPCGPFNVQLKLRDGEPYVFEINPRFSGTVNLTIAAGCDEVGGLIELALGRPYTFGEWREGVVLVRQTHDMVMDETEFNRRAPKGWDA